ncbi:MAG: aminotransferase class IV [Bacteriovoracaceae bacterium]|nr:aminotransferase class IV [Bacteriovoracaceae bacterium]
MIRYDFYETMKIKDSAIQHIEYHWTRIEKTLQFFKAPPIIDDIPLAKWMKENLKDLANEAREGRIRIDFMFNGTTVQTIANSSPIKDYSSPQKLRQAISPKRSEEWNYKLCKNILKNQQDQYDDTLFISDQGEILETTRANIFILLDGELCTPPLSSGVLAGTTRARILMMGEFIIAGKSYKTKEAVIKITNLTSTSRLFVCNGLMGILPALLAK